MREEVGGVLTYVGLMEDLEVSFWASTRRSKRRLWNSLKLTFQMDIGLGTLPLRV